MDAKHGRIHLGSSGIKAESDTQEDIPNLPRLKYLALAIVTVDSPHSGQYFLSISTSFLISQIHLYSMAFTSIRLHKITYSYLCIISAGHLVPLEGFCLSQYSLHVLNSYFKIIQTNKQTNYHEETKQVDW